MFRFKNRLLLLLLLLSGTSLAPDKGKDDVPKKSSPNEFVLGICEDALGILAGFVVLKQLKNELPTEKFLAADIFKLCITYNVKKNKLNCSEFVAETIAQCVASQFTKSKKGSDDKSVYKYAFNNPYKSIPKSFLFSTCTTIVRELVLNKVTKFLYQAAKKLKIECPPEIRENPKIYQGGKFIGKSIVRQQLDYGLFELWKKIPRG